MGNEKKQVYLIDMDGTLYRGSSPIQYAKEFIQYLQENNRKFLLVTNCPGSTADDIVKKLAHMGMEVDQEKILTSGQVTASYVSSKKIASRVYLIGSKALEGEFTKVGVEIVTHDADCVVVGFDKNFSYEKMKEAICFINDGAKFIVTNGDYTIPEGDKFIPHTGAIAAGIEVATGVKPLIIGKPEKYILEAAQDILNCSREECCIIGDRLDTDIAMGAVHGITSYLVMTGVTTYDMLEKSPIKPTNTFENLNELMLHDMLFMEIKSERLILKKLSYKYLDFIYSMESNYLVYQYEEDEEPNKEQTYKKYTDKISKMEEVQGKSFIFLINILPDETPVGEVHIKLNWEEMREWEVGYTLHPDYWGNGYASEAVKLVIKHVFDNLNAHKVVGFCNANNKKSANLMERIGMKRDGLLREGKMWRNEWCDEYVYSILEKDYLAMNKFK